MKTRVRLGCPPPEARNFDKRFLLPTPEHAGIATWNRFPLEWLLPLYKVELPILLNMLGICAKGKSQAARCVWRRHLAGCRKGVPPWREGLRSIRDGRSEVWV